MFSSRVLSTIVLGVLILGDARALQTRIAPVLTGRNLQDAFDTTHGTGGTSSNSTLKPLVEEPFECSSTVSQDSAQLSYETVYPWLLEFVQWTGSGIAECTIVMLSIEFSIFAIDPLGHSNTIATGSCFGCEAVDAVNTAYRCNEDPTAGGCDGEWSLSASVVFEAPPGFEFTSGTAGCVIEGPVLTCSTSVVAGTAAKWNVNLPEGVPMPVLTPESIATIRQTHFEGGSKVDPSKGLFSPGITDAQLEIIFENGMKSSVAWGDASEPAYILKRFPQSGVGTSSSGGASTLVDLVISRFGGVDGGDVITMYPV
ncbi:hypothetical protein B0H13DRAFT_2051188 [Mycena leptocephala]|nr:hypothetical protein B0H13DRAFT_2051188 [Mycena leptocephala]